MEVALINVAYQGAKSKAAPYSRPVEPRRCILRQSAIPCPGPGSPVPKAPPSPRTLVLNPQLPSCPLRTSRLRSASSGIDARYQRRFAKGAEEGIRVTLLDDGHQHPSGTISIVAGRRQASLGVILLGVTALGWSIQPLNSPARADTLAADAKGPQVLRYFKTPGGVKVEEVVVGTGDLEAQPGDSVTFHYVCRRSNGYFVASTVDPLGKTADPVQLPLAADSQMIQGLQEAIQGMRPGGKRRALVPPEQGYVSRELQPQPEEYDRQRSLLSHAREPLVFEVQLLSIRR